MRSWTSPRAPVVAAVSAAVPNWVGDGLELVDRLASRRLVARSQRDLDLRAQQRHSIERGARRCVPARRPGGSLDGLTDPVGGDLDAALSKSQERQRRLDMGPEARVPGQAPPPPRRGRLDAGGSHRCGTAPCRPPRE